MNHRQNALPAPAALMNLIAGKFITQALAAAADLGLADHMTEGPVTAGELAQRVSANADAVYRVLRALAMAGVFAEHDAQRFSLTSLGECLRSDVPGSLRHMARFWGANWHTAAWAETTHAVKTGEPGFVKAHGELPWTWFAKNPEAARVFNDAMTSFASVAAQAVVAAYDFSRFACIADVGGNHGALLSTILQSAHEARGILFDLAEVVAGAPDLLREKRCLSRVEIVAGSFFDTIPAGADAYVLKHIIHDWSDDASVRILSNVAKVMKPDGRLLLAEMVVPPAGVPHFSKMLDLEMLVITEGGKERTEQEFAALLARSGLKLTQVVPTMSPVSVIEAMKA